MRFQTYFLNKLSLTFTPKCKELFFLETSVCLFTIFCERRKDKRGPGLNWAAFGFSAQIRSFVHSFYLNSLVSLHRHIIWISGWGELQQCSLGFTHHLTLKLRPPKIVVFYFSHLTLWRNVLRVVFFFSHTPMVYRRLLVWFFGSVFNLKWS